MAYAQALIDEPLDGIGDLELAARRRLDRPHRVVDARTEQVDARDGEVGRRILRLLDELHDLAVGAENGHTRLTGILDVGEQELRGELVRRRRSFCLERVTSPSSLCCSMLSPR